MEIEDSIAGLKKVIIKLINKTEKQRARIQKLEKKVKDLEWEMQFTVKDYGESD